MKKLLLILLALIIILATGCGASADEHTFEINENCTYNDYNANYEINNYHDSYTYNNAYISANQQPYPEAPYPEHTPQAHLPEENLAHTHTCFNPENQEPTQYNSPIPLELAAQFFAELCALFTADDGYLWGAHLHTPFMFLYPATRDIVVNQPDSTGILTRAGNVYVGVLPENFAAIYSFPTIGDRRWAMLPWPLVPLDDIHKNRRLESMAHMSLHVHQPALFGSSGGIDNSHMNEKDARITVQLEINALIHAFRSTGDERLAAINDALSIRAERRRLFPRAERSENLFEFHEGMANYTATRLVGFDRYHILASVEHGAAGLRYQSSLGGIFGYISGELYGYLLDETGIIWREGLRYGVDLGQLLKGAMEIAYLRPFDEIDLTAYGYEDILAFETQRVLEHEQMLQDLRTAFSSQPNLRIPFGLEGPYMQLNPAQIFNVGELRVYGATVVISGTFGRLEVYEGFFARRYPAHDGHVIATGMERDGNRVSGDGWVLELNDGFNIHAMSGNYVVGR